ncbi:hypothetical protein DERF_008815 [Dermatophagoides farinae]|uniref:protein-glutamine gamma-glutamyltransferase n=1 Tax=Dermatophagoides farinae TaxID=6954 RepID=A0A922I2F0_DERFA|nr:transglutaminase-like protein [Dermatophagoides farinae]KAH9518224.1 hypothetical protein DERF_008815 [Dermatophagoides farinae]
MGNCPLTFCPPSDNRRDGHYRFRPYKPSPDDWASTGRYAAETPNAGDLVVHSVNFLINNNSRLHKTDKYFLSRRSISPKLIVRRGQPFELRITFERRFRYSEDVVSFVFIVKDEMNPTYSNRTEVIVPILDERNARRLSLVSESRWSARIVSVENRTMVVEINSSVDAIIGEYRMVIDTRSPNRIDDSYFSNPISESFYMLFNPWNRNDSVYMKDRFWREEYILNDQGIIWRGTHDQMKPTHWNFAQFEENILEACLYALANIGKLKPADRNDPIKVCRHIGAIVNSVDDKGIVVGNWDEKFYGGTPPTDWHGSDAILQKYYRTKKSVKYGQCWVYSGVTCTICRCIGIPCRVVTNYMSAHDTNTSLTVDRFFDENGDPIEKLNKDSIWNFHSWDEVWMTRPDLSASSAYDGWNLIDATPQEPSDNLYRVGPTSVEAIKYGEVAKAYDGFFVYAEVNADEVYWLYRDDKKPLKLITQLTESIGVKIVTKSLHKNQTIDITENYKHKESSKAERESMIKALKMTKSNFSRYYLNEKFEDVRFELVPLENRLIGESFKVQLSMTNKSYKVYTIEATISVRSTTYNGVSTAVVRHDTVIKTLGPRKSHIVTTNVTYFDYERHLTSQSIFSISIMANVLETDFHFYMMEDYRLRLPDIQIEIESDAIVNRPLSCQLSFQNPLPKPLTHGVFTVEGPDFSTRNQVKLKKNVLPKEQATSFLVITPKTSGDKRITAKFKSRELNDVDGYVNVRVFDDYDDNNNELEAETRFHSSSYDNNNNNIIFNDIHDDSNWNRNSISR